MSPIIKRLKSKTYWAAVIGAVLTVVEINNQIVTPLIPEAYRAYAVMFWPVLMLILRDMTTTALGDK